VGELFAETTILPIDLDEPFFHKGISKLSGFNVFQF